MNTSTIMDSLRRHLMDAPEQTRSLFRALAVSKNWCDTPEACARECPLCVNGRCDKR